MKHELLSQAAKRLRDKLTHGRLANVSQPITVTEAAFHLSEEEIRQRALKIDSVEYKGRTIKLVSLEAEKQFQLVTAIVPEDWLQQVADVMQDVSLVFVEYFPPELERTAYSSRFSGINARSIGEQNIHPIYQPIADLAAEQGKLVAVCDIANKPTYGLYSRNPISILALKAARKSVVKIEEGNLEQFIPTAIDARRMFTARGIMQTVEDYPLGSTFMYVAAPAHINRAKINITEHPTIMDRVRYGVYANTAFGMDTRTRVYEHTDTGWTQISNRRYCKPGEHLKPVLLTAGVAVSFNLARKARREK